MESELKMRKKLLALLVVLTMVFALIPTGAIAYETEEGADYTYSYTHNPTQDYGYYPSESDNGYLDDAMEDNATYDYSEADYEYADYEYVGYEYAEYEEMEEEEPAYDSVEPTNENEIVAFSTQHTVANFAALKMLMNSGLVQDGDTILLTEVITMPAGETLNLDFGGASITFLVDSNIRHFDVGGGGVNRTLVLNDGVTLTRAGGYTGVGGGIRVRNGSTVIMNGGAITRNESASTGGGVVVDAGATFTMNGGEISHNTAGTNGGGVHAAGSFIMNAGSSINNNTAGSAGGGINLNLDGLLSMLGGEIAHNTAGTNGGGIMKSNLNGTFSGGEIHNNKAYNSGGGMRVSAEGVESFTISGVTIRDNEAVQHAGGIDVVGETELVLVDVEILRNRAGLSGGGIRMSTNGRVSISNSRILDNYSDEGLGDAIYGANPDNLDIGSDVEFTGSILTRYPDVNGNRNRYEWPDGATIIVPSGSRVTNNGDGMIDVTLPPPSGSVTVPEGVTIELDEDCPYCESSEPCIVITVPAGISGPVTLPNGETVQIPAIDVVRTIRFCHDGTVTITPPLNGGNILWGDVNDDGLVDLFDLMLLELYVAEMITELPNRAAADVQYDGVIDLFDIMLLALYIAEHPVTLGPAE